LAREGAQGQTKSEINNGLVGLDLHTLSRRVNGDRALKGGELKIKFYLKKLLLI
jgi:hypothetical protein